MAKSFKKYMDVDVIAFLEKQMKSNTIHYQSDFEIDKNMFSSCVNSQHWEDKTLLWLSRRCGTECVKESDAFIRNTDAHIRWRYFAEQENDSKFVAFAVELTGIKDGVIRGNCFELDYHAHAAEVAKSSVDLFAYNKTFEDGFALNVPLEYSSHGFYYSFVEKHGSIVHSLGEPKDKELHLSILSAQKTKRRLLREAPSKVSLKDMIKAAESKVGGNSHTHSGPEKSAAR